jgi:hypothetical protein
METAVSNIRKHFNNKLILFLEKLFLTMKRAFTKYSTFSSAYFHIYLIIRVSFLILGLSFEAVISFILVKNPSTSAPAHRCTIAAPPLPIIITCRRYFSRRLTQLKMVFKTYLPKPNRF